MPINSKSGILTPNLQKWDRGIFEEHERKDIDTPSVYFVTMKQNNLTEDKDRKAQASLEGGFAKIRSLSQLEIITPQQL